MIILCELLSIHNTVLRLTIVPCRDAYEITFNSDKHIMYFYAHHDISRNPILF